MILLVSDGVGTMGGTRTFLLNFLRENKLKKIETKLCLPKYSADLEILSFCKELDVPVILIPNRSLIFRKPYFSYLFDFFVYFIILKKIRFDAIFFSIGTPGNFFSLLILPKKFIYFLHTYPVIGGDKFFSKRLISFFISNSSKLVTVSKYTVNQIKLYWGINSKKITVIYNGVCIPKDFSSFDNVILTVGHVVDYKNPLIWIEVAKLVLKDYPYYKFFWAGDGPLLNNMRAIVRNNNLENNIIFLGFIDNLAPYYLNASVYFHPSLMESQGISILEAMSYKIPCVASNVGGIPESLDHRINGFIFDPYDVMGFYGAISTLIENLKKSKRMGQLAHEKILNEFTIEDQYNKIFKLY